MSLFDSARRAFMGRDYDEYDEEYYDDGYEDEYEEERPKRSLFSFLSKNRYDDYEEAHEEERYKSSRSGSSSYYRENNDKAKNANISYMPKSVSGVEVSIISPTSFDDSSKIVKEVKNGKITVFDMSAMTNVDEARRIVDYICGAAEGMDCPFSRICPSVFCIAPKGVVVNGKRSRY